ncbi:MAG: hypothetical protein CMD68_05410 [Gammaproteobacteria bacterium]|nr:hypothetical protein [Gammaproteobacteria bacterium]
MKSLMFSKRYLVYFIFFLTSFGCSQYNEEKVLIIFEKPPVLKQENDFLLKASTNISKQNISEFLLNQNWINSFLIKKQFSKPLEIFIDTKEPKYIWQEKFYLDDKLTKFLYFGEYSNLLHLNMPIELVHKWSQFENKFNKLMQVYDLEIFSVTFNESEGWFFYTKSNIRINIGSDISSSRFDKLSLTLKYIFEKNLTPSIIDLRYKNGAALNYGK